MVGAMGFWSVVCQKTGERTAPQTKLRAISQSESTTACQGNTSAIQTTAENTMAVLPESLMSDRLAGQAALVFCKPSRPDQEKQAESPPNPAAVVLGRTA